AWAWTRDPLSSGGATAPAGGTAADSAPPQTHGPAGAHLMPHQTKRSGRTTISPAVGLACSGIEFGVNAPNLPERQLAPITPARHRRIASSEPCQRDRARWGGYDHE